MSSWSSSLNVFLGFAAAVCRIRFSSTSSLYSVSERASVAKRATHRIASADTRDARRTPQAQAQA
eukprot:3395707-Lingulodinium_polyedra.AAC.1